MRRRVCAAVLRPVSGPQRHSAVMPTRRTAAILPVLFALWIPGTLLAEQAPRQERAGAANPSELGAVGVGKRISRQGLGPGAYISTTQRQQALAWVAQHHGRGQPCLRTLARQDGACVRPEDAPSWRIGEALPPEVELAKPPKGLLETLPEAPPGNRYAMVGGDVLLVADASRMVVDAVVLNPEAVRPAR